MNNTSQEENTSKAVIRYGDEVQLLLFALDPGEERYLYYKDPVENIQQYTITRPQEENVSGDRLLKYKWKICPINQNDVGKPVKANDVVALYNIASNAYLDAKSGRDQDYDPGDGLTFANQNDSQKNSAKWKIEKVDQSNDQQLVEGDYLKLKSQSKSENSKDVYLKGETNSQESKQRVFSFGKDRPNNGCYWQVFKQKTILTEIEKKYQELGGSTGILGSPCREEYDVADGRKRDFQNGSIHHRIIPAPLSFVVQNMGLLPKKLLGIPIDSFTYKGREREQAIASLMQNLRQEQPDVVGLCEVFDNEEKERIKADLRDVYPHSLEGPDKQNFYYDGGLLLLSQHDIVNNNQIVYSAKSDLDSFTNKGVLYARLKIPAHPTEYNVFLTHTQDAEASVGAPQELRKQLTELEKSIKEWRNPHAPTLLMGDLNVNGRDASFYNELLTRLDNPENLMSRRVVTYDEKSSFAKDSPSRPVDDSARHTLGQCLDYFLLRRGKPFESTNNEQRQVWSTYENTQVVVWQSSPGWDISDHYGLKTQQKEVNEIIARWK